MYQRFCQAVLKDNDIDPHKAALLKEDETALSNSFTGCAGVPAYVFPRDISHLRNAYQETGAAGGAPADSARSLSFSIRDPASGEDSIPAYSEVQTPLSQDAIIDAIARELVERETRLVFIAASNPLDVMFLMRAIRQVAPDIRIITDDPQILMVPEASRDPLSGTVVLSTYPMFADGERWLDPSGDRLVFPDPWAQGTYNVAQFLLADLHALFDKQKLSGYSQFAGSSRYPGMWALSLTRSGFLPLAYYGGPWKSIDSQPEHRCGPAEDCGWMHAATPFVSTPPTIIPPRSWRLTVLFLGIAALLGSLRLVWCNISVKPRKPIWLAVTDGGAPRMLALIAAALALSAVQWVLLCPVLNLRLFSNPAFPAGGLAFGLLAAAGLLAPLPAVAFVVLRQARRYQPQVKERKRLPLRAVVYPAMVFGLFLWLVISWALLCYPIPAQHADSEHQVPDAFFLRFRAVDLYSGSSPAAPLMVLAVIFFLISIFYFKRYTTGGPNGPRFDFSIKSSDAGPVVEFRNRWVKAVGDIEECVLAPSLLSGPSAVWRAATGCLAAVFCLLVLNRYPAAFEHFTYNLTLWVLLSFVLFWLAIGCYDLWTLWKRVHKMLDLVELLRLQPALKRISQDWPRRPVWAFRQSVSKHLLDRQMIYALHGRVVTLKALQKSALELVRAAAVASQASVPSPAGTTSIVTTVQEAEKDVGDFTGAVYASLQEGMQQTVDGRPPTGAAAELARLRNYQQTAANIASRLLQSDLRPFWRQSLEQEDSQDLPDGRNKTETLYLRCCADFVALQCCRYAADKVEHVQRIASCISLTFVLLLVFFNAYSVEGPQAVARFLALLFLVIGYLIVRVLAAMERNPILSAISRTKSGELNVEFWVQLVSLGALPLIGVLAHLFPSMSRFLFQWVAPGVQAVH
ncbi:MAG TPA: hypothetical protein VMU80_09295 [Bryobacteraceae bacterium]|nr:hypothetical protein [Bryobacteraceae bacterium]